MRDKISSILNSLELNIHGFCRLCDTGELLNTRNRSQLPKNAKSVITFLFPYKVPCSGERNVSLYALGLDYHDIILKRLNAAKEQLKKEFCENEFSAFCDNSPIRECGAAYHSGLGFLGQNSLIIHPKYGSYCFIGEIVTDLEFDEYSVPLGACLNCGHCIANCIGGALIKKDGKVLFIKENCLSFITQKKGILSPTEEEKIKRGGLVWGCDTCSVYCPMNSEAENSPFEEFYLNLLPEINQKSVKNSVDRAYGYKGEQILSRNLGIIEKSGGHNN